MARGGGSGRAGGGFFSFPWVAVVVVVVAVVVAAAVLGAVSGGNGGCRDVKGSFGGGGATAPASCCCCSSSLRMDSSSIFMMLASPSGRILNSAGSSNWSSSGVEEKSKSRGPRAGRSPTLGSTGWGALFMGPGDGPGPTSGVFGKETLGRGLSGCLKLPEVFWWQEEGGAGGRARVRGARGGSWVLSVGLGGRGRGSILLVIYGGGGKDTGPVGLLLWLPLLLLVVEGVGGVCES